MERSAHDSYLTTEVRTATPPKLQLILIEAALRSAGRAGELWRENRDDEACGELLRAQDIVGELLAALDRENYPEMAAQAGAVYLFIFRRLLEAGQQRDPAKLDDAVRVLEVERETWRQVCRRYGSKQEGAEYTAAPPPAFAPPVDPPEEAGALDALPAGGFSLEA